MTAASTNIWQIFYSEDQKSCLDTLFVPLDNSSYQQDILEFGVFKRLFAASDFSANGYFGALSWRFLEKTGFDGVALITYVQSHPEVDLFFMNPYPHNEALHQSLWVQGETAHPGFLEVSEAFFEAARLEYSDLYRFTPSKSFSACNYFVARPVFWNAFIPFVQGCLDMAEANMTPMLRNKMHSSDGDWKGIHKGATYIPFIIERLLPVFLRSPEGRLLRTHQIALPVKEAKLSDDLLKLREMKDVAILTRSTRILDLWREKRESYCSIYFSKTWNERYKKLLNEAPVVW